jgi:hypothetical protein
LTYCLLVVKLNLAMRILPVTCKNNQSGQALLLVLLSMAVILTAALSVASRSITDISVSTYENNALRAFSAAEAGVEKALLTGSGSGTSVSVDSSDPSVKYTSGVSAASDSQGFKYPALLKPGESASFWLVDRNASGNLACTGNCFTGNRINICWGASSSYPSGKSPAVLVSLYYDLNTTTNPNTLGNVVSQNDYTYLKVVRRGYDPDSSRRSSNNFFGNVSSSGCSIDGTALTYRKTITFNSGAGLSDPDSIDFPSQCRNREGCFLMARVRVFYNDPAKPEQVGITVSGGSTIPAQGKVIESTGVAGDSTRRVNVFQMFPEPPSIFDAAVFSLSDFTK